MLDRELKTENIVYEGKLICEKWHRCRSLYGFANVERLWSVHKEVIKGKKVEIQELLGYRAKLPRNIMGNICTVPDDAVKSAELVYEKLINKAINELSK